MGNNLDKPVKYLNQLPINIGIYEIEYCPIHLHRDIEIVYVLKGSIALKFSIDEVELHEGDLFIINSNVLHDIRGLTKDHQMILMRVDISQYTNRFDYLDMMTFFSNFASEDSRELVKKCMKEIYTLKDSQGDAVSSIEDLTEKILSAFVEEFQLPGYTEHVHQILNFIYNNYDKQITFDDLADSVKINFDDLEDIFLNSIGLDFENLLNAIRIEESEKILLGTNNSVEEISTGCGFTSVEDYIENFSSVFGETPTKHREKLAPITILNMDIKGRELSV